MYSTGLTSDKNPDPIKEKKLLAFQKIIKYYDYFLCEIWPLEVAVTFEWLSLYCIQLDECQIPIKEMVFFHFVLMSFKKKSVESRALF